MYRPTNNLLKVQLNCEKNNKEHRTDDIAPNKLIVRRGKPFQLTFLTERPFQPTQDYFEITVETGPNASESKGTKSSFGFQARSGPGKPWSMQLISSTTTSFTVSICPPANACVGLYSLSVKTTPSSASLTALGSLIILFNPWCEDDSVYMVKEEERREYVMSEQGMLYTGSSDSIHAAGWDFGQFEDDVIDICLKLLDKNPKCVRNAAEDFSARCSPIYVGRVVSAMINVNDYDNGVLAGRWDGSYSDGVNPGSWSSSVEILRKWIQNGCGPVKYGQCWVFAAVMCTVLRRLGIPCRVVTNFDSAHDTNTNLTVDVFINENGVEEKEDSIWNFHVWVEAWMKRPDISDSSLYDGWQVLDPTPQEKSEGSYCCGPAPLKAILEGHTNLKYDVPFVFAEVNADVVKWIVHPDGSRKKLRTDTSSVGNRISTKAVGTDRRLDITNLYKHQEGSKAERDEFNNAMRNMGLSEDPAPAAVVMKIEEVVKPVTGSDIKLNLTLRNTGSTPQTLILQINAQTMRYTGTPSGNIYKDQKEIQLQPNKEQSVPITIPFADYGEKMLNNNSIKVSAVAKNAKDPKEVYMADKDIVPHSPPLTITVKGTAVLYNDLIVEVMFENPLSETLKNCSITLAGSGLLSSPEISQIATLNAGQRVRVIVTFQPYRTGLKKLVADFQCSNFTKINTSCNIDVKPSSRN
ncbi:protein-glutamine gamma-glutamyltransferase 2-like [Astyanax mexicanus]|uniref:Protein-glutamine gamma-glutamyltransferase 2 n=1 Tax=Astyanax mexicanus TaxID=7994 RepID=A0A8T2M8A3_ASTMX|nr:protein-glutamine gamma-glutamyltransferase 2-like [Astyanax mexicanus]